MNAAPSSPASRASLPRWVLGLVPLLLVAAAIVALATVGGDTLGERTGPPVEELSVAQTTLRPGEIELKLRNDGPDEITVAQAFVNDAYVDATGATEPIGRLGSATLTLDYPWQEGSPLLVSMLLSTGAVIEHEIDVAVETPQADAGFYGLMALLGVYVGVIPVALGMLFLPFLGSIRRRWMRGIMGLTVGLLGFLAVDGYLEGLELGQRAPGAFGGVELLFLGAAVAYFALVGVDRWLAARRVTAGGEEASGLQLALLIAIGIGLHNLGEGLAIGSAYSIGALALGAFLVVGFAIHNTTEGIAIVAPLAAARPRWWQLASLGLIAGAPAILGAWIGASSDNPSVTVFMLGLGIGAIVQVIVQIWPSLRDGAGRALDQTTVIGILIGVAVLYLTGLLVSL